jgi:hypothetical protein
VCIAVWAYSIENVNGTERNNLLKSYWSDENLKIFEISLVETDIKCQRGDSWIKFRQENGGTNVKTLFVHEKVLVKMVPTILTEKKNSMLKCVLILWGNCWTVFYQKLSLERNEVLSLWPRANFKACFPNTGISRTWKSSHDKIAYDIRHIFHFEFIPQGQTVDQTV